MKLQLKDTAAVSFRNRDTNEVIFEAETVMADKIKLDAETISVGYEQSIETEEFPIVETILSYYKEVENIDVTWEDFIKSVNGEGLFIAMAYDNAMHYFQLKVQNKELAQSVIKIFKSLN